MNFSNQNSEFSEKTSWEGLKKSRFTEVLDSKAGNWNDAMLKRRRPSLDKLVLCYLRETHKTKLTQRDLPGQRFQLFRISSPICQIDIVEYAGWNASNSVSCVIFLRQVCIERTV
jgi:hypothetical protein